VYSRASPEKMERLSSSKLHLRGLRYTKREGKEVKGTTGRKATS
jgi:hypothetical protein